jgi:hypothetical protein
MAEGEARKIDAFNGQQLEGCLLALFHMPSLQLLLYLVPVLKIDLTTHLGSQ